MKFNKKDFNPKYEQISRYVIFTALILMLMYLLFSHLGLVVNSIGTGLRWLGMILRPLIYGAMIAYLLYPIARFFKRRLMKRNFFSARTKIAHGLSVLITVLIAFFIIFLITSILISSVSRGLESSDLDSIQGFVTTLAKTIQNFFRSLSKWLDSLNISSEDMQNVVDKLSAVGLRYANRIGNGLIENLTRLPSILSNILFTIIFAIYFLIDGSGLMRYWSRVLDSVSSKRVSHGFHVFAKDMNRVFSGYIRGQLIDALVMFLLISVSFSLAGIPYALLIGILTGLGNLIPYIGPILAYGSSILVNLVDRDVRKLVISLILVFIIQTIDGNVINPKLLSKNVQIHPVLVIVSLIIGAKANGFMGMLLAVPIMALLKTEFERIVDRISRKRAAAAKTDGSETPGSDRTSAESADAEKPGSDKVPAESAEEPGSKSGE